LDRATALKAKYRWSNDLKLAGCLLLLSGALIVVAALALLPGFAMRSVFTAAGVVVELLGLGAMARGHMLGEKAAAKLGASTQMRSYR
jgi:hypothetical protein